MVRLLFYTYNIDDYIQWTKTPLILPQGQDGFVFYNTDISEEIKDTYEKWGWTMKKISVEDHGTSISNSRILSKCLKWNPEAFIDTSNYDTLVSFDFQMTFDVDLVMDWLKSKEKGLLSPNYTAHYTRFPRTCGVLGEINMELKKKIRNRTSSCTDAVLQWRKKLEEENFPTRYCHVITNFQIMNPHNQEFKAVRHQVYEGCKTISRDQFLLPYYLWKAGLKVQVVGFGFMRDRLKAYWEAGNGFGGRNKMN